MLKKILCLLLSGLMLASTVACASDSDTDPSLEDTSATVTEEDTSLKPDLPEITYDGEAFRILTDDSNYKYIVSEKTGGELVNDAIVEANMSVTDQFDVTFERINGTP